MNAHRLRGIVLVLVASALWSASGSLTKQLRLYGFEITDVLAWRYLTGALALLTLSAVGARAPALRLGWPHFPTALRMALMLLTVTGAFTWSNFFTTVANAIALSFTTPLFTALLGWFLLGERVRALHQVAIAVGAGGVSVFALSAYTGAAEPRTLLSPNIPLGNVLALLSGVLFSLYIVVTRKAPRHAGAVMAGTTWQFLILAVLLSPLALLTLAKGVPVAGYAWVALYGTLCTAVPILLLNLAGLFLGAHEISLLALSELPFTIVIGMLALGEFPVAASWIGAALILVAGVLGAVRQR